MERQRKTVKKKKKQPQRTFVKANPCFLCQMIALADCADSFRHLRSPQDEEQLHSVTSPEHPVFLAMWWALPRRHSAGQMLFSSSSYYWRTKNCRWYLFLFQNLNNKEWTKLGNHRRYGSCCFLTYLVFSFILLMFFLKSNLWLFLYWSFIYIFPK